MNFHALPNASQNGTAQAEQFKIPLWTPYKVRVVCWDHADGNRMWIFACRIALTAKIRDMKLLLLLGFPWLPDRLVLQDASPSVSVRPFFLGKRFTGKSCVLHSGRLLALTWGSPLEEIISNSVKSQYHCR